MAALTQSMPGTLNVTLPPVSDEPLGDSTLSKNKVYFTIFAGRKRYLSILKKHLDILLENNVITEVHLWDYVRNPDDAIYIQELNKENPRYVYIKPTKGMPAWNEYYQFYTNANYAPDDIVIKCDDDVVYLDTDQMCKFLNEIKPNGLYYPNIVNNDVCAYVQTKYGVHNLVENKDIAADYGNNTVPLTGWGNGWYKRFDKAAAVHKDFLENTQHYRVNAPTFPWKGRISINMFGARFQSLKKYFDMFMRVGANDDEAFFSVNLYKHVPDASNHIVPFVNIAHFGFGPQNVAELDKQYLEKYAAIL